MCDDLGPEELEALVRRKEEIRRSQPQLEEDRQRLNDMLRSQELLEQFTTIVDRSYEWLKDIKFKEQFCQGYRQLKNKTQKRRQDLDIASLVVKIAFAFTVPVLTVAFMILELTTKSLDRYCQEFVENE
ncbi:MAG TPA: hypothetical protein DCF68_21190 [Cyanothece sp. UBA12306]|nr:hypothetical protein [Cyanothece sp. UBA12306]